MLEPSIDDIKRFEKKVYFVCLAGLVGGALLIWKTWGRHSVLPIVLDVIGIALAVLSLIMLGFFINFFYKLKKRMRAGEDMSQYTWPKRKSLKTDRDNQK